MYFRRALKLNRHYLSAWTLMGHEYVEMKNPPAAIGARNVILSATFIHLGSLRSPCIRMHAAFWHLCSEQAEQAIAGLPKHADLTRVPSQC